MTLMFQCRAGASIGTKKSTPDKRLAVEPLPANREALQVAVVINHASQSSETIIITAVDMDRLCETWATYRRGGGGIPQ